MLGALPVPLPTATSPGPRAARPLRRKTVPAPVSGCGGGADAAGRPGAGWGPADGVDRDHGGVIAGREVSPASSASLGAAGPVLSWRGPREGEEARAPARLCRWPGRWPAAEAEQSGNLTLGDGSWSVSSDWGSQRPEGPGWAVKASKGHVSGPGSVSGG